MLNIDVTRQPDIRFQDGGLPHAVGVRSFEIMHADRDHPECSDSFGWTYNHAPMLCWYHGRYYVEYLSSPVSEHESPGHTLLCYSVDGVNWSLPQVVFPPIEADLTHYKGPDSGKLPSSVQTVPHQRMGFYRASNDCMLILSFYGIVHNRAISSPCDGWGVGRVLRRLYPDGSLGDIYFLMFNEIAGFDRQNTNVYPHYSESGDKKLIDACEELLDDWRAVIQFYEEQRYDRTLFPEPLRQAPCTYTAYDGNYVTVFKRGYSMISDSGGKIIREIAPNPTLKTSTGKVWGQKTADGRYSLIYNPTPDGQHRWPLAILSSDDGYNFSDMRAVTGRMSPQRYGGLDKNLGPQYIRGICEYNPQPPDDDIHIVYSNNKEDIWISHIPPQASIIPGSDSDEKFGGAYPLFWNIYSPKLAPVVMKRDALCLTDGDIYDAARVERVFSKAVKGTLSLDMRINTVMAGNEVCVALIDENGNASARISVNENGRMCVRSAGRPTEYTRVELKKHFRIKFGFDCSENIFYVSLSGKRSEFTMNTACWYVTRIDITTKVPESIPYCDVNSNGKYGSGDNDLPLTGDIGKVTSVDLFGFRFHGDR